MLSNSLDINNTLATLNQLTPKKRLDFIINHKTPLKLVRSMASTDLLLTIREIGDESSLELIEMMHPHQVQEIFDLEVWSSDRLNIETCGRYFSLLLAANRDSAIAQLHGLDIELIGLMLKMVTKIYDVSLGEEPIDYPHLYSTSPDGRFIVCFLDTPGFSDLAQSLHTFLEELYGRDIPFVLRLLESVRFELASGLEEEALKWRQNRLLDLGILPNEERLEFFAPLSGQQIKHAIKQASTENMKLSTNVLPIKMLAPHIDDRYPFLKSALADSSDETKESFWHGLTHAIVNMHASLSGDFGDRSKMIETGEYVKFLTDFGLCQAVLGKPSESAQALTSPKFLIRLAKSALLGIRRRLVLRTKGPGLFGENFCHADPPLREVALAISLPEPRYYEGLLDPKKLTIRFFGNYTEVNATIKAVNELIFRAELVGTLAGLDHCQKNITSLPHSAILARYIVNSYLGTPLLMADISFEDVQKLFHQGTLSSEFKLYVKSFGDRLAATFSSPSIEDHPERISHFLTTILIQLEQNWQLLLG